MIMPKIRYVQSRTVVFITGIIFYFLPFPLSGQLPSFRPPVPAPASFNPNLNFNPHTPPPSRRHSWDDNYRRNDEMVRRDMEQHERKQRIQQQELLYSREVIAFPEFSGIPGTEYFRTAREKLEQMLAGEQPVNLKRAVYLIENAYLEDKLDYNRFDSEIQNLKRICLLKMKEEKLDSDDPLAKIMMIFRVMTDVVRIKEPGTEKQLVHYPMKYDFEDYRCRNDMTNYMVSKLLSVNAGQCHSLPLLFLILAEELGTEAYLSSSPSHLFVKFSDGNTWYNAELTQGAIVSDDFYMSSGFIKSEALRNGLYLQPLDKKQLTAQILTDLTLYYVRKYGFDSFVKESLGTVLKWHPNNIDARLIESNYHTARALHAIRCCGSPPKERLPLYPQVYELYNTMLQSYAVLDSLGYEDIPDEVYRNWIKQTESEKDNRENRPSPIKQIGK